MPSATGNVFTGIPRYRMHRAIRRFDDFARPTIGIGSPVVPNVIRQVPVLGSNVPRCFALGFRRRARQIVDQKRDRHRR
jgi:hypothetical protein